MAAGDLRALLAAFGCPCSGDLMAEWRRDLAGLNPATIAVIFGWRLKEGQPIRMPSGARRAREIFLSLARDDQRAIARELIPIYGLPPLRDDQPTAVGPDPAPAA